MANSADVKHSNSAVRTKLAVVHSPALYFASGALQRHKPVHVQIIVPKAAAEGFDMRIVRRHTGSRIIGLILLKYAQASSAREMNSGPLSTLIRACRSRRRRRAQPSPPRWRRSLRQAKRPPPWRATRSITARKAIRRRSSRRTRETATGPTAATSWASRSRA